MDYKAYDFDETKLNKRETLLSRGVSVYPYDFKDGQKISTVLEKVKGQEGENLDWSTRLAGRIWSIRRMGKSVFIDLRDNSGKIQLYLTANHFSEDQWELIPLFDLGDIIGITGSVFRTKTGELTIKVDEFTLLCKAVVPIPIGKEAEEKVFYRVSDPESKYRERYLHWLLDTADAERIRKRGHITSAIRRRMEDAGFLEVSTPTIEFIYGGAEARPFKTSIWALGNKDAFLRISPELFLKRYIVAGFDKVFTICQNFRNEGIDHSHNPEFTTIEWYEAFTDYEFQMQRFENLVSEVCQEVCGSQRVTYQGTEIDFTPPWQRLTMLEALKKYANIDAASMSVPDLAAELKRLGRDEDGPASWGLAVVELFETTCEDHLVQPVFILDHPIEVSPLTKIKRGDQRLVERFEPFVCGMEIGNAYSELNDPVDQLERFMAQRKAQAHDSGKEYEDNPLDADFVKAIGCGMPPTGGVGLGIDRLVMLLTDSSNIRDIIPFPMIKPHTP
jgi:lysyl-tRNA synthetase class 2